jgi:hypothetical protein
MALIKAYELNTGLEAPNAYHVITKVDTYKRPVDDPDPAGARPENSPDYVWKAGYYGRIAVSIYASKSARDSGKDPIAARCVHATDVPGMFRGPVHNDSFLNFGIDISSTKSVVEQAYDHLKTLEIYSGATED